jgi:hypothetical protein
MRLKRFDPGYHPNEILMGNQKEFPEHAEKDEHLFRD